MSTMKPLYDRDEAPTDRRTDVILLLAAQDDATYRRVREQLDELDLAPFPFDLDVDVDEPIPIDLGPDAQPAKRDPFDSLEFLATLDYVERVSFVGVDVDEPIGLAGTGRDAAAALRAGLDDDQAAALDEVLRS